MVQAGEKAVALPRIGDPAPIFQSVTTQGMISLEDYRGKWVILFSHPADFTPVCTTEFIAFNEIQPELKKRGVELLGLSVDSLHSHIAWLRNIEEKTGVKINFPIISDSDRYVSTLYGMMHPGQSRTETVRCVFIIDPKKLIRAILYYPPSIGRNVDEILRLIDALQTSDQEGILTPANWKPGEMVIVPEPETLKDAETRILESQFQCVDWYLCKKKADKV